MSLPSVILSATGLYTPPYSISNDEMVAAFNQYVVHYNQQHAEEIAAGTLVAKQESSSAFIEKASGIKSRYVMEKTGLLDPDFLCPRLPQRPDDELCLQAEIGVAAAQDALKQRGLTGADVDMILLSCSNMQRAYPAVSIEIQAALGSTGYAFDMSVACSSAVFGLQTAYNAIACGNAKRVLVISAEICSGHMDFRDRDSHFIFGDAATAMLLEREDLVDDAHRGFAILGTSLSTTYSNNIRNNFGFTNHCDPEHQFGDDKLFKQQGRKVFKEVSQAAGEHIVKHLQKLNIQPENIQRFWLHQANQNMNQLIVKRILGREASAKEAPIILDRYANTSSAGSIIALHLHQEDLKQGDLGVISCFGAGYSIGSVIVQKR
ncbi:MAG: beta-ketoacyl-ACP synthase III [Neisseriaceae bacterium]|nr:beta-ketoacyl-ACP synthase III [Neisseriaceae bacterium]